MTILSFVEGALPARGGMGLVGVPMILRSVAARGNRVALLMGGPVNPDREHLTVPDPASALQRQEEFGAFGIVNFKASPTWAFAPSILPTVSRYVKSADFITLHSLYSFPVLAGYILARMYRRPYAVWPHGVLAPFQRTVSRHRKWIYDRMFTKRILDDAAVLIFSSVGERDEVGDLKLKARSAIVADGMDAEEYANLPPRGVFRAKYFGGHEGPLIAFLARLNAKKGLDLLVKSMSLVLTQYPEARLAVVGPPDPAGFDNQVRTWIHDSGIVSQTVITGGVSHQEKRELLADCDVFVLPSEAENFGHSIFEAMASGVPVVISDTLNYAGMIAQAGAGFAVKREPLEFSARVANLLADAQLRKRMGAEGKRFARRYSWQETGKAVEAALASILEDRPLPASLLPVNHAPPAKSAPPIPVDTRTQDAERALHLVSFSEGALPRKGGIGIAGVPLIMASTASKGHRVVTLMGGPTIPGRGHFTVETVGEALDRKEGHGTFGIVPFRAFGLWAFSPAMFSEANRLVKESDFVGLHSLYSFPVALGYVLARYHRKPYFVWLHGVLATFQRQVSPIKKWVYGKLLARRILARASVIFFTANGEREQAHPLGLKAPKAVVPTGFIAEEFANMPPRGAFRARFLGGFDGPLIIFLGRLNAKKGLDLLTRAMALVIGQRPDARLAVVGPPAPLSFERCVREWVAENGIERHTTLTGAASPAQRLQAMADADILVMPSYAENFGFSVFEAMASGVPVVVSDTLDYAMEIQTRGAGLSVPREAGQFADAIIRLVGDPELRRKMGQKGIAMASAYSWRKTGERVDRVLKAVLAGQPVPLDLDK